MIDNIKDAMTQQGIKTFETNIRKNTKIAESPIQNLPLSLYAPKSNGGMDYHNWKNEILAMIGGNNE